MLKKIDPKFYLLTNFLIVVLLAILFVQDNDRQVFLKIGLGVLAYVFSFINYFIYTYNRVLRGSNENPDNLNWEAMLEYKADKLFAAGMFMCTMMIAFATIMFTVGSFASKSQIYKSDEIIITAIVSTVISFFLTLFILTLFKQHVFMVNKKHK